MDLPIALALGAGFAARGDEHRHRLAARSTSTAWRRWSSCSWSAASSSSAPSVRPPTPELLARLTPSVARVVEGETIREIPAEALLPDMTVEVRAGETFPADGVVVQGDSLVDLALLTGESRPVRVEAGSKIWAGTVNLGAAIRVRVTQAGEESRVGRLLREVEAGAGRRARIVLVADRLAGWFVAVVLVLAALTWVYWHRVRPGRGARQRHRAADRDLPVRARARDAARGHRRDRSRGAAGHPDQGRRRARAARAARRALPRQDRHRHRRQVPAGRVGRPGVGEAPGRGARAPLDSSRRRRIPRGVARRGGPDGRRGPPDAGRRHRGTSGRARGGGRLAGLRAASRCPAAGRPAGDPPPGSRRCGSRSMASSSGRPPSAIRSAPRRLPS